MSAKSSQCIPGKVFCRNSKLDLTFIDMGSGRNFRLSLRPVTLRRMKKKVLLGQIGNQGLFVD